MAEDPEQGCQHPLVWILNPLRYDDAAHLAAAKTAAAFF